MKRFIFKNTVQKVLEDKRFFKFGFSLSEVLVTLGIISVLAVMTIPLVNNYQTSVQKTQFKRSYATLANGLLKARADLGYEPICSYGMLPNGAPSTTDCLEYHTQLFKSLNVIKTCANQAVANGCIAPTIKGIDTVRQANDPNLSDEDALAATTYQAGFREINIRNMRSAYVLADGTNIIPYNNDVPFYLVDINGLKNPNKWGYDIFILCISYNKLQCVNLAIEPGGTACSTMMKNMN